MKVITLGPLSMDASLLFSLLALFVMFFVAGYIEKKKQIRIEKRLWLIVLLAVVVGRVAFVWQYWPQYQHNWLQGVNIRDGGFSWQAALLVGVVVLGGWLIKASAVVRRAVVSSVAAGATIGAVSLGAMHVFMPDSSEPLPKLNVVDLNNNTVALSQYEGKPVVLNLWASWCPPCQREMPVLEKAQQQYPEVHIVFANQAESADVVRNYLEKENLNLDNVLLDTETAIAKWVGSRGLPTTLFIDAEGTMQSYRMGELSEASLYSHLKPLLP